MFYVKEKISETADINIEINDENVFCRCPYCGKEVQVDIADILSDGESDLFCTSVLCDSCTKNVNGDKTYEHK